MADKKEKIFAGGGKKKSESWLQVTVKPDVLEKYIQEYEGNKFVKLNINIKAEPNQYGKDVEVTIDTWQPQSKGVTETTDQPINQRSGVSSHGTTTRDGITTEDAGDLPF